MPGNTCQQAGQNQRDVLCYVRSLGLVEVLGVLGFCGCTKPGGRAGVIEAG
jgi:hypothetical protein